MEKSRRRPVPLQEQIKLINECRQSGMSVADWCREHQIASSTFYKRLFQSLCRGIDTLYSCRKFFGVPDGGYAYTSAEFQGSIPVDVSMGRMKHILGRFEGNNASDYYEDFNNNDESFKEIELRQMSKLTHNILGAIDYAAAKRHREDNFLFLSKALGENNLLKPECPPGPYAYPFYIYNGMAVKKELAKRKIYVATLWPNVLGTGLDVETDLTENILPLPCDQRYSEEDMQRVVDAVTELCYS